MGMVILVREASAISEHAQRHGKSVVLTHGAFDLLHPGHLAFLEGAGRLGDLLVVGVHKDVHVRAYKGDGRPIFPLEDRLRMISALRVVDFAIVCPDATATSVIEVLRPDIYVKDNQRDVLATEEAAAVSRYEGRVCILPYSDGVSTTAVLQRLLATVSDESAARPSRLVASSACTRPEPVNK
jgi:rfaE bifunctional protein nucleotidyltransferase chain/domain